MSINLDNLQLCHKYDSYVNEYYKKYKTKQIKEVKQMIINCLKKNKRVPITLIEQYNMLIEMNKFISNITIENKSNIYVTRKIKAIQNGDTLHYMMDVKNDTELINIIKNVFQRITGN